MIRNRKRLWALLLSAVLIVTQLPAVAMAENNAPEDKVNFAVGEREDALGYRSIASFKEFPSGVAEQTVEIGTERSALNLPEMVTAHIYQVIEDMAILDEDDTEDDSSDPSTATSSDAKDSGKTVTTVTTITKEIPVTWDSAPDYDGETEGKYVFTADVGGYALSGSAKLPEITVTVAEGTAGNQTENPMKVPCTQTEGCTLTDGHKGECVTELPPVSNGLAKNVTGWSFVVTEHSDYIGEEFALPGVNMERQADFDTVVSMLPVQISAKLENETDPVTVNITGWACPEYVQDDSGNWPVAGEYVFTAELDAGYTCNPLPTVKVTLGGGNLYSNNDEYDGLRITGGTVIKGADGQIKLTDSSADYTVTGTWTGTLDSVAWDNKKTVITVPNGVTTNVKLSGVSIDVGSHNGACAFAVAANGTANITLAGNNTLTSGDNRAGLEVPEKAKVTINGNGSLEATGGGSGAGIGGGDGGNGGTITISGNANVKATGGGAGIGGGAGVVGGSGGTIEISDNANVTAIGNYGSAGIGGGNGSMYNGGSGGTITISGNANVTATGGADGAADGAAGIGGGSGSNSGGRGGGGDGGNIKIKGGTVKATGAIGGAGIGGGSGNSRGGGGSGGTIEISGGIIHANGGTGSYRSGAGIGGGSSSSDGSYGSAGNITIDGNPVVFAKGGGTGVNAIGSGEGSTDKTEPKLTQGVVFEGEIGTVYGSPQLPGDVTIPKEFTLTVLDSSTLAIPDSRTLTNNGTIENYGTVSGSGTIKNNGTINDHSGGITVTVVGTPTNKPSEVKITFLTSPNGQTITQAAYGDTITVQAKVAQKNTRQRNAMPDQVIFKVGNKVLETANVTNGIATFSLKLTGDSWQPGSYTITAEYGGGVGLLPNSTATADLTVLISSVEVNVPAPVAGNKPADSATVPSGADYKAKAVTWEPSDSSFQPRETYKVTVTLEPESGYAFSSTGTVSGKLNGHSATITNGPTVGTITLSYEFDKLPDPVIAIQTQPANITVTEGKISGSLIVAASVSAGGSASYAWYSCDDMTKTNPQSIGIATAGFSIPTDLQEGTYHYFCRISATGANDIDSSVAVVTVKKESSNGGGNGGGSYTESEPQSSYTMEGDKISRSLSHSDLKKLADSGKSLTLRCDKASMTFDPAALKAILAAVPSTVGNITFAAEPADLSAFPEAEKVTGAHPVYDFTISYKDSKGNPVVAPVNFPTGSASISLTYTPAGGEVTGSLFMVYVDGTGAVTWLDKSSYDSDKVLAEVPHFSTYGVAYKAPVTVFSDIANHWAREDIEFVAARGLLSGTGNNLFSPDATMTRGMFAAALGRLAGVDPASHTVNPFTDVDTTKYYAPYTVWAAEKGIVNGTTDTTFAPDAAVTRQEMAVMMVNYARQTGYSIPAPLAAVTFTDNDKISAWMVKEVAAMQQAGIIKGKDGNRFDPQGNATCAEVSAVLRRFVEIVIDPATATGWVKNDSGHWLYYKGGKALTGWREIGGKWYYFDESGVMAVNTRIDGYEIGPDGAWK